MKLGMDEETLETLCEDAQLMRELKAQLRGVDVTLSINEHVGYGHAQVLANIWRRIMLEANQGV